MRPVIARAFTLIELLVVVGIISLLISIMVPSLANARESARRVHCAANLAGIAKAMHMYASDNAGVFPCMQNVLVSPPIFRNQPTGDADQQFPSLRFKTADGALLAAAAGRGVPNQCMWMLVLSGLTVPKLFICRSDPYVIRPSDLITTATALYPAGNYFLEFEDEWCLSYSISYPWGSGGIDAGPWWHTVTNNEAPVACDMAPLYEAGYKDPTALPGTSGYPKIANSGNHANVGQNVAYGDAHVDWTNNPYVGLAGDNIFTMGPRDSQKPISIPWQLPQATSDVSPYDTIMVPVRRASNGGMFVGP
jgi:prepilin-type N-terminal cleavage/methylation domain-containing protein